MDKIWISFFHAEKNVIIFFEFFFFKIFRAIKNELA